MGMAVGLPLLLEELAGMRSCQLVLSVRSLAVATKSLCDSVRVDDSTGMFQEWCRAKGLCILLFGTGAGKLSGPQTPFGVFRHLLSSLLPSSNVGCGCAELSAICCLPSSPDVFSRSNVLSSSLCTPRAKTKH